MAMVELKEKKEFKELKDIFSEITHLRGIRRLLSWDQETFMPKAGEKNRADQIALISTLIHQKLTSNALKENLYSLLEGINANELDSDRAELVILREWKRDHERAVKIPETLIKELSYKSVIAHEIWVKAREEKDFNLFLPHLSELIKLTREKAKCLGYEDHPYDALLDEYEPYERTKDIDELFNALIPPLKRLYKEIIERLKRKKRPDISGKYPIERQKALSQIMASSLGLKNPSSRIDTVVHPFSTKIGPGDVRITTRWNERDFTEGIFGILHEAGHGIYSQNLLAEYYGTPLGESVSLGIHESQSRLYENIIGRSKEFWEFFFPISKGIFPDGLSNLDLNSFLLAINWVEPSFIRVEADEVTYNFHIYLRFTIEKELIEGSLSPVDIPLRWNTLFEELLGLKIPDDSRGCLQDVHWSGAAFGYFPTYTLGNVYGAMLFEKAKEELPGLFDDFKMGKFRTITRWLGEKVHSQGRRYRPKNLIEKVTGNKPTPSAFLDYLQEKYKQII